MRARGDAVERRRVPGDGASHRTPSSDASRRNATRRTVRLCIVPSPRILRLDMPSLPTLVRGAPRPTLAGCFALALGLGAAPLRAAPGDAVRARLVAGSDAAVPGTPVAIAVVLDLAPGWHVNWINPGDAGLAPSVAFEAADGVRVEPVRWPAPSRFRVGPLVIFGYDRRLVLPTRVHVPHAFASDTLVLRADVTWLACAEACVPGEANISLALPVRSGARRTDDAELIARAEADVPHPDPALVVRATLEPGDRIVLAFDSPAPPERATFFPRETGIVENSAEARLECGEIDGRSTGCRLSMRRDAMVHRAPDVLEGILVLERAGRRRAITVRAPLRDDT